MNFNYALTLSISTVISAAVMLIAWRRHSAPGAKGLAFLMLSFTVWSLTYTIRWMSSSLTAQYFWLDATYFGVTTVPLFFTIFTLQFTNRGHLLTRRNPILLSIEPVITLLLLWTDNRHGLFYGGYRTTCTIIKGGPWFYFNIFYSYILNIIMLGLFIQAYRRASHLFRRQVSIILVGALIPFAGNVIILGGLNPFHDLDLTPILFIVSGMVYAFGLFRYQILDVLPIARDKLFEDMLDGLIVLDVQNRIVDINPAAQEMTRVSSSWIGKSAEVAFAEWTGLAEIYNATIETSIEICVSQDPPRDVEVRVSLLFTPHQNLSGRLIVLRDITERKSFEAQMQESEEKFRFMTENSSDVIWHLNNDYCFDYISPADERMRGFTSDEILGKTIWSQLKPEGIKYVKQMNKQRLDDEKKGKHTSTIRYELEQICKDGSWIWTEVSFSAHHDSKNNLTSYHGVTRDSSERKRFQEELQKLATTDGLTGIFNRRHFLALANTEREHALRLGHSFAIVLFDIDHFKKINDTYGHAVGDQALQALSKICRKNIRSIDMFARFGGDEFVLLLPGSNGKQACQVMEHIRQSLISEPLVVHDKQIPINISAGVASFSHTEMYLDALIERADRALYQAKESGRNRVVLWWDV